MHYLTKSALVAIITSVIVTSGEFAIGEPAPAEGLPELTPEELEQYEFDVKKSDTKISDLTVGQQYVLRNQRTEVKDLVARKLGVLSLRGDQRDLPVLQKLVDQKLIKKRDVREWQGLGIVFGDILAAEFDLHWVSYEDERGVSKSLRWQKTENYVFAVTLFSKRVQFEEEIELQAVFDKLSVDIAQFKEFERKKATFKRQRK